MEPSLWPARFHSNNPRYIASCHYAYIFADLSFQCNGGKAPTEGFVGVFFRPLAEEDTYD